MKKNLKKVISAVLALTLALSSFVALNVSAATFADVADTASYAEAVNALAALGAISGYEDGTFLPNNNITRAEATTMVVAALNLTADAQSSGSTTQFADVNANAAWAAGYVNVGVAQGFISGMSATEFAPSENVTYAQMLSILTRILGYGEFAEARGGWPNGYLTAASTAGILSGVSAGANDAVTRAQVAQLIWNAVQAPMLDITTFSTSLTGSEMQKMDGKDERPFKTVLSDKFDAYVLNVTVDETSKSNDALEAGTIKMTLTGANDWDPEEEVLVKNSPYPQKDDVAAGKTDAENYIFSSAKVVAEYNDDEEWTLIYFAPTAKVAQKVVDGSLVANNNGNADKDGVTADYLRIKKSATTSNTTNYKLMNAVLYVNGVEYKEITNSTADEIQAILEASYGDTTLVEDVDNSGYYNRVMTNFYAVAKINQITAKSDKTKVSLSMVNVGGLSFKPGSSFEISADDIESGDEVVTVTKAGAAADLSALAKDDVVAIAWDVNKTFDAATNLEILATTDVVTGKYTSYDEEDELYYVAGTAYEATDILSLEPGVTYTFYLDPLGRLYDYEEEASSKNFAIVERYINVTDSTGINYSSSSASEYDYVQVMTLDGQSKTLYIDGNSDDEVRTLMTNMGIEASVAATAKNVAIADRIVEYDVRTSNGRINGMEQASVEAFTAEEYNENSNKLGKTLTSTAVVIDATDYDTDEAKTSDYKLSSLAALEGNVEYDGILVHKNTSNEYAYVIITGAGSTFSGTSDFAVVASNASASSQATVNDDDVYQINVMTSEVLSEGGDATEVQKLNVSESVTIYVGDNEGVNFENGIAYLKQGSVFFYSKDSDGFVDEIYVVYQGTPDYADFLENTTATILADISLPASSEIDVDDWKVQIPEFQPTTGHDSVQLFLAPVITARSSTGVTFGEIKSEGGAYYVDVDETYDFSVASDANIYSFDLSGDYTGKDAFDMGFFSGVETKSADDGKGWINVEEQYNFGDVLQFAFVMAVDEAVTNAVVFTN